MSRFAWIIIFQLLILNGDSWALAPSDTILEASLRVQEWTAAEAQALLDRSECLPTRFGIEVVKTRSQDAYRVSSYGRPTSMMAYWETDQVSCSRRFGVVQWIRGCIFTSYASPEPQYSAGVSRKHRGKFISFYHPEWVVDTEEADPLYSAPTPDQNIADRNGLARWVAPPVGRSNARGAIVSDIHRVNDPENYHFLFRARPRFSQLYVTDHPTSAYVTPRSTSRGVAPQRQFATHSILEFETCLYPIESIPRRGDPARPGTPVSDGGPLHCWSWDSKALFDHATQTFKTDASLQDCSLAPWR